MRQREVASYPNRDIPSPEPVYGRRHLEIQTDEYREILTDKPMEHEVGVATEFYLDRPPVPLFTPRMPAKDCCKSTQIYDGDHELFDFDREVEPMLNVLIEKTLDQARMEVLEEHELQIIKEQSEEYQEVRNAELIEAQRYEAAEARIAAEIQRRGVQQKARKEERIAAHSKHIARVVAKKHLEGLRERGLEHLQGVNLLENKLEAQLQERVMPWLFQKIDMFMAQDEQIAKNTHELVETGIREQQKHHAQRVYDHKKEVCDAETTAREEEVKRQHRKQERRRIRQLRVKEQIKQVLRDEIFKVIVDKGDVKNPSTFFELMDLHSNFSEKPVLTTYGGHFQQLYYVVCAIMEIWDEDILNEFYKRRSLNPTADDSKKALNPRELLVEQFFLPFLASYFRDNKMEAFTFMSTPEMQQAMQEMKVGNHSAGHYDLSKMNKEQYIKFRHFFIEQRMYNPVLQQNSNDKAMDLLLQSLCLIMCKKVPSDLGINKVDQLHLRIKLLPRPENAEERPTSAVVRLTPTVRPTSTRSNVASPEDTIDSRFVDEIDQEGRAVAMNGRQAQLPYQVPIINQLAARHVRDDFANAMSKHLPEFFKTDDGPKELKKILAHADRKSLEREEAFIADNCSEFEVPLFDIPTDVHSYE